MTTNKPNDDLTIKDQNALTPKVEALNEEKNIAKVIDNGLQKTNQANPSIDPEMMKKVKETADIIFSDVDSPEWMKVKLQIKWMGYNPKKAQLMRKRVGELKTKSVGNQDTAKNVQTQIMSLVKEADIIFPILGKAMTPKGFMYKLAKYLPFVGGKVEDYLIKLQTIEQTMENMMSSLQGAEKELQNTNTELDVLRSSNKEDIEESRQQIIFGNLLVAEIKNRMLALPESSEMEDIVKKQIIEKDVLLPVITRISDLNQKTIVSYQGIMNMTNLKEANDGLVNGLRRAQDVTVFALQQQLISFMIANRQGEISEWLDNLNKGTNNIIGTLTETIKNQSIAIAERNTSQVLDIETIKKAWDDAKQTLLEVEKIYKEALPKMEQNLKELEEMNKEAEEHVMKIQDKENIQNKWLNIIDDLGK